MFAEQWRGGTQMREGSTHQHLESDHTEIYLEFLEKIEKPFWKKSLGILQISGRDFGKNTLGAVCGGTQEEEGTTSSIQPPHTSTSLRTTRQAATSRRQWTDFWISWFLAKQEWK